MPTPCFTSEELHQLHELARQWAKIVSRRAFGDDGPGLDVNFRTFEQVATAAAHGLTEGTLQLLLRQQADKLADAEGEVACLVQVWDAKGMMPTGVGCRRRSGGGREECRKDDLEVVKAAGGPLTGKEGVKALREAGKDYGQSTMAKALADLTAAGELVNPKDKRGYRLAGWKRDDTPSLF